MAANTQAAPGKPNFLTRVWGSGPNAVYASGFEGVFLRHDGKAWAMVPSGTTEGLGAVFGFSPNDVFVVGGGGIILHHRPK